MTREEIGELLDATFRLGFARGLTTGAHGYAGRKRFERKKYLEDSTHVEREVEKDYDVVVRKSSGRF